jgi:NADPH:quinone reductase-like Zn-dependent oxidoreductase
MAEQNNVPTTQQAWFVVRKGHPSKALELKKDAPVPTTLEKGQALVKVQAAALNPVYVYNLILKT